MEGFEMQDNNLISATSNVEIDLTRGAQYRKLVDEEIKKYSNIEVTENLTEGGIFASKSWAFYFSYLFGSVFGVSFHNEVVGQANKFEYPRLLSLGCGYGGHDLRIARKLRKPYELIGIDLNPRVFIEAERRAASECLNVRFKSLDLNFIDIRPKAFDVIYADASLHHILNLEHLFFQVYQGLKEDGRLIVHDIIGKNQVIFWRENVEFAARLVKEMPLRYRPFRKRFWRNYLWFDPFEIIPRYEEPSAQVGMEGIRQEEIEPLIMRWFTPTKLFKFNAYMRMICTNSRLGPRFDPDRDRDREYLEKLIKLELQQIESGKLRPTEMFGVFKKIA